MHDDPSVLSADERRAELATILAQGVLHLHRRRQLDPLSLPQIPPESCQNRVDVPLETSVHGARPVNAGEIHREEQDR